MSMANAGAPERRRLLYSGRVQGVGFRYTTRRIAQQHVVSGFVRNLADGRVEVVAEATPEVLDRFLGDVAKTLGRFMEDVEATRLPATGEWQTFEIAY